MMHSSSIEKVTPRLLCFPLRLNNFPQLLQPKTPEEKEIKHCPPSERAEKPTPPSKIPLPKPPTLPRTIDRLNNLSRKLLTRRRVLIRIPLSFL